MQKNSLTKKSKEKLIITKSINQTHFIMVKTKLYVALFAAFLTISTTSIDVNAQVASDYAKAQVKAKASKSAKNEAKKLKKEGWDVKPGALPLERQLDRSYTMQFELDDEGQNKYVFGSGSSVAGAYDAAKVQAMEMARQDIASQIESEITTEIESTVSNHQLSQEEAATLIKITEGSKGLVSQSLGRLLIVMEAYRNTSKDNVEVLIRAAYNYDNVKKAFKSKILEELEKQGNALHKKMENNWKK